MYKIRNKKLAILLTIVFVLSIMLPLASPAAASTSYSALTKPTVSAGTDAWLGDLYIKIDPMAEGTAEALVTLPSNYEILNVVGGEIDGISSIGVALAVYGVITDDNEFKLTMETTTAGKKEVFIPLQVAVPSGASGDVVAEILNLSGQLSSGSVVLAVVAKGAVTVSCGTPEYISDGDEVTFTITENAAGALKEYLDSVKLTLPKGYTWGTVGTVNLISGDANATVAPDPSNDRVLRVSLDTGNASTQKSVIRFNAEIEINEREAKYGDIEVAISGKSSVSPSKLVVAKYGDYGFNLSVEDATEFLAGRYDQEIGNIVIEETAPNSFIEGRAIYLTLPSGAKWSDISDNNLDLTDAAAGVSTTFYDSDRTAKITLGEATGGAGKIIIEEATVSTAVNFKGDLKVEVSGSAGVEGELVVATVNPPISVSADKPNVKIGVQGQAAGDIVIAEVEAEALIKDGELEITFSNSGVTFDATPTVEVIEGDVEVDVKKASDQLTLTIDAESTEASTIKISGITYTVNRAYPEGNVELKFAGNAVDEVNDTDATELGDPLFSKDTTAAKVVNAVCVTPAPGEEKQSAVFVIGSTTYTVNGVEAEMDVAPYVKDGRTYLPVRYAGYALGVAEENIFWDNSTGTATLIKGDRVVQFTIGQKAMIINGASVALDVAPEITNGRTMLPFRWIATAFGASVDWDGETQTVTMEL